MTEEEIAQLISEKTAEYVATFRTYHEDSQGKPMLPVPCSGNGYIAFYPELTGQPLDALAISMIYALRSSKVRIMTPTNCVATCDCCLDRITITLDAEDKIVSIKQEVPVISSGADFNKAYFDRFGHSPSLAINVDRG